jgi:hypothetical protein
MPFTFSHAAAVLPLLHKPSKYFSATGLIIGSISPDFEYFLKLKIESLHSHTLSGLFYFDLPLGLIVCFLYHNLVRNELLSNLPDFLQRRFLHFSTFNWNDYYKKHFWVVLSSLTIGAFTHIFWDAFTHETGFFVERMNWLQGELSTSLFRYPRYKILQHISTMFGGITVALFIYKLPQNNNSKKSDKLYWIFLLIIASIIVIAKGINGGNFTLNAHYIAAAIGAVFVALCLAPALLKLKHKT